MLAARREVVDSLRAELEAALERLLELPDEEGLGPRWAAARSKVRAYALRPGKRLRPALLLAGHAFARGELRFPSRLVDFAAGLELLHTFLLIHDDVADRAPSRRGGPALHAMLGTGKLGENLAVVAGDHLFARAIEVMLGSGIPRAPETVRYLLAICRQTAAGQHLDLELTHAPFEQITLFQVLNVAQLKTARYGFVAPLVCGAMLAGADAPLLGGLERMGRHAGVAFQLADDLLGLFGVDLEVGKSGGGDYLEAKRTFPVVAAWTRADDLGRARLEHLWAAPEKDAGLLAAARAEVTRHGGRAATERTITRTQRLAARSLAGLPEANGARELVQTLLTSLTLPARP